MNLTDIPTDHFVTFENHSNNICKSFSNTSGITLELPGYTYDNSIENMDNILVNNDILDNINKLEQISKLQDNWDGDNAKAFSTKLIEKINALLIGLKIQPEIFPTACDTIQLEYEKDDGSYLEFEIAENGNAKIFMLDSKGDEKHFSVEANLEEINKVVNSFYG